MERLKLFALTAKQQLASKEGGLENIPKGTLNVQTILYWIYAAAGLVAVVYLVYAGVSYIMAQGEPAKVKKASQSIAYGVIGLVIVILVGAFTSFLFTVIGGAKND